MFGKEKNFILLLIVIFLAVLVLGSFRFGTDWMVKAWTPFLQTLMWPIILIIAMILFKSEFKGLITRMQTLKMNLPGGTTIDMVTGNPDDMKQLVTAASQSIPGAVKNTEDAMKQIEQEEGAKPFVDGNPDTFQLLCKFESKRKMKSTKVMNVANGCIVQATTRELSQNGQLAVAEALTFVPDLNVVIEKDQDGKIAKAEFVKIAAKA